MKLLISGQLKFLTVFLRNNTDTRHPNILLNVMLYIIYSWNIYLPTIRLVIHTPR